MRIYWIESKCPSTKTMQGHTGEYWPWRNLMNSATNFSIIHQILGISLPVAISCFQIWRNVSTKKDLAQLMKSSLETIFLRTVTNIVIRKGSKNIKNVEQSKWISKEDLRNETYSYTVIYFISNILLYCNLINLLFQY